jgi:hypothetical protein
MKVRAGTPAAFVAYVSGYLAIIAWFKWVDVYHAHFATAGPLVLAHNVFRVAFIFYLFWIVCAVGMLMLRLLAGRTQNGFIALDDLALSFFAGAGVWHIVLLGLGYLNLYTVPVAVGLTLPAVILSFRQMHAAAQRLRQRLDLRQYPGIPAILGSALVILVAGALLLVKGLYPDGGHDYFQHYFYFYQKVIDSGGIWPNEVWYQYYYSKGAGLYFLATLLTDPMAPQLVTSCFMAAAALIIFLWCRRVAAGTAWSWVAVVTFLAAFIYTPIWGQFEKLHELNTCFIIAILWSSAGAIERSGSPERRMWAATAALTIVAAVVVTLTTALFLGAVFSLLMFWYLIRGERQRSLLCFGFAAITGTALVALLAINYGTTGLFHDQGIVSLWPFADLEKLDRWGVIPQALIAHWGNVQRAAETAPLSVGMMRLMIYAGRLDLLLPLAAGGLVVAIAAFVANRRSAKTGRVVTASTAALAAAIMVFLVMGIATARTQPLSFFRHASFMVPIMIVGSITLWTHPRSGAAAGFVRDWRTPPAILAITLLAIFIAASQRMRLFDTVLPRAWHFATGTYSIDTAYTLQTGWPDKPWGAIYPGARGAYAVVGPRTPIWSMNDTSYCMLPDCRIEGADSFKIGAGWDRLMFGTPEQGRDVLQAAGLNYFLFSRELTLHDYLPLSPLLRPDNIARYFGIRWTDGISTLLTWSGPDTIPLDPAWVAEYRRAVEQSPTVQSFPYADMQTIFARLNETPHPWASFKLSWGPR